MSGSLFLFGLVGTTSAHLLLGIWLIAWARQILTLAYAVLHFRLGNPKKHRLQQQQLTLPTTRQQNGVNDAGATELTGVTILKPIICSGSDYDVQTFGSNLETFFVMPYPGKYELLLCVEDVKDNKAQLEVCEALMEKFPKVDARLLRVAGAKVGANPDINLLYPGYIEAKYELVLISDARLRIRRDTLLDMVLCMDPNVGLVHQLPFLCDREGFSSFVEKVHLGTANAKNYLAAHLLLPSRHSCVASASVLFRKSAVDEFGGLKVLGRHLGVGLGLANLVVSCGFKVKLSHEPAWLNPDASGTMPKLKARLKRWFQLQFAINPASIPVQLLSDSFASGIFYSYAAYILFNRNPATSLIFHLLAWLVSDYLLLTVINGEAVLCSAKKFVSAEAQREFLACWQMLLAPCSRVVRWRGVSYMLDWGGVVRETLP